MPLQPSPAQPGADHPMLGLSLRHNKRRGAAMAETLIVLPVLLLLGLGTLQWGLIFEAKATLNHATLMAARAGAVNHLNPRSIRLALARALVPLYSPDKDIVGLNTKFAVALGDVAAFTDLKIVNPTQEAFDDFAVEGDDGEEIPNKRLHLLETAIGATSGVNVQDANLLKLEVLYGYELKVPYVGPILATVARPFTKDPRKIALLTAKRLPLLATSVVRMQSEARENGLVQSREDVEKAFDDATIDDTEDDT